MLWTLSLPTTGRLGMVFSRFIRNFHHHENMKKFPEYIVSEAKYLVGKLMIQNPSIQIVTNNVDLTEFTMDFNKISYILDT